MAAWILIPSLVTLRSEFNLVSPGRDKGADGSIGDSAHTSSSDHTPDEQSRVLRDHDADSKNEVHALDIDSTGPWPGQGTQKERFHRINMRILDLERAKWRSATDRCRLNYLIWDGRIYDKDNDFQPQKYTGSDPHTNHAHYSGRYETACENDTRPWGVYVPPKPVEEPVAQPADESLKLTETAGRELFEPDRPAGTEVAEDTVDQLAAIWAKRAAEASVKNGLALAALEERVIRSEEKLDQILALLTAEQPTEPDPS
jgi:hypothetical protein